MEKRLDMGGQAVIEGVMMKSKNHLVTAVRKNGRIIYRHENLKKISWLSQLFFMRGIVNLAEMLVISVRALNWSASKATEEDGENLSSWAVAFTLVIAFLFGIGLFILLPYALTYLLGIKETSNPFWFNVVDGIIKVAILVLYVYLISLMKDIRRVFQYHGAEHKAVFCYEGGRKLTVDNAKRYSTLHPRCGTAFLMIVIILGVFLFSFIPLIVAVVYPGINALSWGLRRIIYFISRILLLPVIAGLSYEALKFGAKHRDNPVFRLLVLPGLWIQKITTRKPSKQQLEVALFALRKVLEFER